MSIKIEENRSIFIGTITSDGTHQRCQLLDSFCWLVFSELNVHDANAGVNERAAILCLYISVIGTRVPCVHGRAHGKEPPSVRQSKIIVEPSHWRRYCLVVELVFLSRASSTYYYIKYVCCNSVTHTCTHMHAHSHTPSTFLSIINCIFTSSSLRVLSFSKSLLSYFYLYLSWASEQLCSFVMHID